MQYLIRASMMVALAMLASGCDATLETPETQTDDYRGPDTVIHKQVSMTHQEDQIALGAARSVHVTVDLGSSPKDLYAVLANGSSVHTSRPTTSINTRHIGRASSLQRRTNSPTSGSANIAQSLRDTIDRFNATLHPALHRDATSASSARQAKQIAAVGKSVGDERIFYLDATSSGNQTRAILTHTKSVSTAYGTKTVDIWISKESYQGASCTKKYCVSDAQIKELADTFLSDGMDNDIYDWVTNIYGEEWGPQAQQKADNLIDDHDTITILLTDIEKDNNPSEGMIGYFYSKDNYKQSAISGSNETVMFYIDSVIFANPDTSKTDWKKETYATLAHEFQHMIHFYQKAVLLNTSTDIWLNELLSETTEDLIATKIGHTGPRGVDPADGSAGQPDNPLGRYPLFDYYDYLSLSSWNNSLINYSKVSAFGTFLTRNYGGAKVLHDILYNNSGGANAIEQATNKSMQTLLGQWGVAILLSDRVRPAGSDHNTTYNTGDYVTDTYQNATYKLGAINFYNYAIIDQSNQVLWRGPKIFDKDGEVAPHAIYLYKIGENLSGKVEVDFANLNGQTSVTLVTK